MFNALAASWSLVVESLVVSSAIFQYISLKPEADVLGKKSKRNGANQAKNSQNFAWRNSTTSYHDLQKNIVQGRISWQHCCNQTSLA